MKALHENGRFNEDQAEATAMQIKDAVTKEVTTKADIDLLRADLAVSNAKYDAKIDAVRAELKGEIAIVRTDMAELRTKNLNALKHYFVWTVEVIGIATGFVSLVMPLPKDL